VRIAFHAINGVGLGHLVRVTSLAAEVRSLLPRASLLVLTNAADPSMLKQRGLDFIGFPPRLVEPHADPDRCRRALPLPLEHAALTAALSVFRPDLVVFDTHAPIALARHAAAIGARSVLVQRELRPDALRAFLSSGAAASFDRIVVPHEPGEVDLGGAPSFLPVVVSGPVVRRLATKLPARAPLRLEEGAPLVVAMAGGGGQPVEARRFLRAVADAHLLARGRIPGLQTVLVAGPYGSLPEHIEGFEGLVAMGRCSYLPALVARASLVVSQAGYNAVAEIRALEKPAILVPGERKAEDQSARAKRLARAGAAVLARSEARSIADRIEALLTDKGALSAMVNAHRARPFVPQNRAAAEAILRPVWARAHGPSPVRRAVLVAHDFAPKLGGMESVARSLALGLSARGVDVRVYTAKRFHTGDAPLPAEAIRALYTLGPGARRIDLWGDLLLTLDALLVDAPDVVHLCHAGLGPWVPALRAALPAAVTVSVHGNDLLSPWVHHGGDEAAYQRAQVSGLGAADAVLAVSAYSAGLARAAGVAASKIETIENGVDSDRFSPGPPDLSLAARLGGEPGDEVVLTVSRLSPRKGHATALRALAALARERPKALYVFTGENERLGAELHALAGELGITGRIRPIGFVGDAELPALYRLARVFVLLSDGDGATDVEGFGVALLEAAASGLPVVATRTGGIPEAVLEGETGVLVPPGDAPAAAAAIAALLADPARARALGERGRERVLAGFSSPATTGRVLSRWSAIVERGPRSPARSLGGFGAAFEGATSASAGEKLTSLREELKAAPSGVALVRRSQREAASQRAAAERRRATFERILARGGTVRLRATGTGARLLIDSLADCASLGHKPEIDVKLRRFVEADFQAHALPQIAGVHLCHSAPMEGAAALLSRVAALPGEVFAKVRSLRVYLTEEAHASPSLAVSAAPEIHALRRLFTARGAPVLPPPELMRYLSETPAGGPETGMIEPTNLCNLACPTCPTGTGKIKPLPQMSLARFEAVISALAPRLRNLALWNYGEPLLNRDLPAMIGRAKEAGVKVVKVSSNVHFLDGERGRALLASGLDVLILSVDGASQASYQTFRRDGDFERVSTQVAWICAEKKRLGLARPRIELQFIVMRHNEHELPEIRRLAAAWGVDRLRIKTVGADDEATRGLVPTSQLLSRYREDRATPNADHPFCTMAWDHTVVNVDGSVTPCCYLRPDMGEEFVMGNVFEAPFLAIWRGDKYRAFRAAMLAGREAMPVCNRCRGGTHDLLAAVEEVGTR
jgi:radical SAM protein with 4Fe4S-binding SPASM domain